MLDRKFVYTREEAIETHVRATRRIAMELYATAEKNKLNSSFTAEIDRAVVEMIFNPQMDVDRSRVMDIVVDEFGEIWTGYDHDTRLRVMMEFFDSARARRYMEGTAPLYLRMRGRSNEIVNAWQRANGEEPLGIRDVWYQFDWTDLDTVERAVRFAINYGRKETNND